MILYIHKEVNRVDKKDKNETLKKVAQILAIIYYMIRIIKELLD